MCVTNRHTYTTNKSRLGSESFTGWLGCESNILVPPSPLSAKSSNEFDYSTYGSPIGVLTTQTVLTDLQSIITYFPATFP